MPAVQTSTHTPFGPAAVRVGPLNQPRPTQTGSRPVAASAPHSHAHSLTQGDQHSAQTSGARKGHVPMHWQIPSLPERNSLQELAGKLSVAQRQALLRELSTRLASPGAVFSAALPYPDGDDTRSPHRIVQTALALALKDKSIDVAEASELRGLLLTLLPPAERAKYRTALAAAPMASQAEPILRKLDPDLGVYQKDFSQAEIALIDSPAFKLVFPNFQRLDLRQQRQVISELNVFLRHFPNLLPTLNGLRNDSYGPGFQYFFLDPDDNEAFDKVIPKGMAGVVMPGANVVKDPLLRLLANKISLRQLDRGGMYIDSIRYGVFSHEFAHVIHLNSLNDDQRDGIKNLYDKAWQRMRASGGTAGFVSDYAQTNPYEYFAEGIEHYLCGGADKLKASDPGLYAFVADLFAAGKQHSGADGHLFSDPERVHIVVSQQGGRTLAGVSVSRESDLFSVRRFEGGITQELAVLGHADGVVGRASVGLKAAWKPWDSAAGIYATAGGTVQAGALKGVSIGAGGYAGAGVDYKHFNAEVRQNWIAGANTGSGTEIRAGLRFEF